MNQDSIIIEKLAAAPEYESIIPTFNEVTSSTFMQPNAAYRKIEAQGQQGMLEYDGYVSLPLQESGSVDPKTCKVINEEEPTYDSFQ